MLKKRARVSYRLLMLLILISMIVPFNYLNVMSEIKTQKIDAKAINSFGYIGGSLQRASKLYSHQDITPIINDIDAHFEFLAKEYLLAKGNQSYFLTSDFEKNYKEMARCWAVYKKSLLLNNSTDIINQSELCWVAAKKLTDSVEKIAEEKQESFVQHFMYRIVVMMILLGVLIYMVFFKVSKELERDVILDPLTGVNNRKYFRIILERLTNAAINESKQLALVFIDIDHFKLINDRYGHDKGDLVLKTVAEILTENFRASDVVFRYGGEEFVVLIHDADFDIAMHLAQRFRQTIERKVFCDTESITISAGVTLYKHGEAIDTFVNRADMAMYEAKKMGRNNVVGV
jgi:diguanylate cyclase (GGDEF)-like protein